MAGAVLLVAAALLHLHLARGYFRRRLRRRLDPALAHVVAAFAGLGLTVVLGVALLATPGFHPRQWIAYGLVAVLGWLVPFLLGILYKLVAHLSWIHFYGRRTGADAITVQALLSPRLAWSSLGLLCAGLLTLVAGIFSGIPVLAGSGAAIWCAGALLVPTQYLRMLTR
jgi:hypothetical protein